MQPDDQLKEDEALAWAVRTLDPAFADWDAFTRWLEASPAHGAAYDRIAAAAVEAGELALPPAANDEEDAPPSRRMDRRWFGGALAACAAGLLALGLWQQTAPDLHSRQTAPGQVLAISLGDGSRIDLAGDSRIALDRNNPRFARLERGRALFTVRHDDADPFRVEAGGHELLDVGTVFDVRDDAAGFVVAVQEGAVLFDPDAAAVRLDAGDRLAILPGSDTLTVSEVTPADVGTWRDGRLTFAGATLLEVAADLARASGHVFTVAPGAPRGSLTGSILVDAVRRDPASAGALLGVTIRRHGDSWMIGAP
jgi:transmembrane sensor